MVIGTTSEVSFLDSIGLCDAFGVTYHVPTLKANDAKKVIDIIVVLLSLLPIEMRSLFFFCS